MEITTLLILLSICAISIFVSFKYTVGPLFMVGFCGFVFLILMSFCEGFSHQDYEILSVQLVETPISIVAITHEKVFEFKEIEDRSILKAKNFYVRKYKNAWGINLPKNTILAWL